MTEVDSDDSDYTDGKRYSRTLSLVTAGDTVLNYRFAATNGTYEATGAPTTVQTVIVE